MPTVDLRLDKQHVRIDGGELIGYLIERTEYIHQKGSPGWRNSDTEMFPIIGPTAGADFKVSTPRGAATQDQHGLLRELSYATIEEGKTSATFEKRYTAGTPVANSKFPAKSTAEFLSWPYDFRFLKTYELSKSGLTITFTISGGAGMPFMLGYHPAFRLTGDSPTVEAGGKTITLDEVIAVDNRALRVPDCREITLHDEAKLRIRTEGFGQFMLWTEVPSMICIEPITFYPYDVAQENLADGFQALGQGGEASFRVELSPAAIA